MTIVKLAKSCNSVGVVNYNSVGNCRCRELQFRSEFSLSVQFRGELCEFCVSIVLSTKSTCVSSFECVEHEASVTIVPITSQPGFCAVICVSSVIITKSSCVRHGSALKMRN